MSNNKKLSGMFHQIAALLNEQGVAFKPAAYRRAAQFIEEYSGDITKVGDEKELKKLPGIGEAIAAKIVEFRDTGKIKHLDELRKKQGDISAELMDIEALGPKLVRTIQKELGIHTVAQLIKAAEDGKLRTLPRLSEGMEQKILENAKKVSERTTRFPREEIADDVEKLLETIKAVPGVDKASVAGSFRREKETVGDIDILVVTKNAQKISDAISKLPIVRNVVAHGERKISFDLHSGLRVDVRLVKKDQWGSALLYFTGSKEHNIAMRKKAIAQGWKLSEYGLFDGDTVIASKEEKDIYDALALPFYEPNQRSDSL